MTRRRKRLFRAGKGASYSLVSSAVSAADGSQYIFSNLTLGEGLIVIAGNVRAAAASTLSSVTVAGNTATIAIQNDNGNVSKAFLAYIVNTAASGNVVLNLSVAAARAGVAVYLITGYKTAAPYLTAGATRTSTAGTMSPDLVGTIKSGVAIASAFNGLNPGHRISTAARKTFPQTNYSITVDCQSGVTTWPTGLDRDIDLEMEATGTAVVMSACSAAWE